MSKLYIVPTPIGNLKDMTFRAIEVLKTVDFILAETPRNSRKVLQHFAIETPLKSYHLHNEHKTSSKIVETIKNGTTMALVSDAGTPAISDPGYLLINRCIDSNIPVETLPGASALIPAIVNSGFPSEKFIFEGFLPTKKSLQKKLVSLAEESRTIILYESPHRLVKTLKRLCEYFGEERKISVSRELSKIFEETLRGETLTIYKHFLTTKPRGEFVIVISGKS